MKYTGNTPFGLRQTDHNSSGIFSAGVERITIDSNGEVGIGTTSPGAKLHVAGGHFLVDPAYGVYTNFLRSAQASDTLIRLNGTTSFTFGLHNANMYYDFGVTGGSSLMRITGSGNVGIGTTNPFSQLEVKKDSYTEARIRGNSDVYKHLSLAQGGNFAYVTSSRSQLMLQSGDATYQYPMQFYTGGSARMVIDTTGRVGIGTTSPLRPLHVSLSTNDEVARFTSTQSNDAYIEINSNTSVGIPKLGVVTNDFVFIPDGSNEAVRFTSDGKVGIGTTSPTQALHVDGKLRLDGSVYNGNLTYLEFDPNASDSFISQKGGGNYLILRGTNGVKLQRNSGTTVQVVLGEDAQKIIANGSADTISFLTANSEKLRILANGNIGIGTTSPTEKLHVLGDLRIQTTTPANTAGTARIMLNPEATTPAYIEAVAGFNPTSATAYSSGFKFIVQNRDASLQNPYYTIDAMAINANGNVGIGTNSPTHKLQVAGTFKSVGINDSASAQAIFINGNGEVGIGVTNQTTALDVGGVFQFSTATDLLQINNNTNTGGINLSGNNSRIYFGGHRAIEGNQGGSTLTLGEGYSNVQIHSNATLVANGAQTIGSNLTVSGRTDLQRDLRLRGTDASPNLGVVRMYVDSNDTLFIDAANDGSNRVEINAAGDLTVPGIITAQEFRTEYISQTIIFESGSTTFGDDADDVHTRNGSVIINKNHTGVLTGNKVDALVINNDQMGSTGPETRIKFQANSNPTATISTKVDGSGVGGGLSFEVAENPTTLTTRLKISKDGFIGMNTDPATNALLKLGLRNMNGDGILLENIGNSNEVAKLYQDNGTEGILSLSNSGLEHVKIRSNGASFFDGGTVGFGTQTPSSSHKVDIVGDLKVGGTGVGTGNYLEIIGFNQSNTVILRQFDSNSGLHTFRFQTALNGLFTFNNGGSSELVRFDSQRNYFANNVGIGTLSAATPLDIVHVDPIIRLEDTQTGAYSLVSGNGGNITLAADEGNQDGGSHIAFKTDTAERARITSSGNFGIGTSSPGDRFTVQDGTITSTDASGTNYAKLDRFSGLTLKGNGAGSRGVQTPNTDALTFGTNATERMRIDSSGRVFIGTTTYGANNNGNDLVIGNTSGTHGLTIVSQNNSVGIIYFGDNDNNDAGNINYEHSANQLRFVTNRTQKMVIDSNGNVGVGTTSPGSRLDVRGDIRTTGFYLRDSGQTENHAAIYSDGTNGYLNINNGNNWGFIVRGHDNSPMIGAYHGGQLRIRGFGSSNGFNHANDIDVATINFSTRRVGIGTTSPLTKLNLADDSSGAIISFKRNNSAAAGSKGGLTWIDSSNYYVAGISAVADGSADNSGELVFRTSTGEADNTDLGYQLPERMRIDSVGNVGIGTTSPTQKLDVNGVSRASNFRVGAGGDVLFEGNALLQTNNNSFILNADVNANGAGFISLRASNVERVKVTTSGAEVVGELSVRDTATVRQTARQFDGAPAGTRMETFDGNTYIGAFIDYTVYDDSKDHMRSGTIQMVFNATGEARFTDNSTTDIGNTSQAYFQVVSAAPNTEIKFVAPDSTWHVRYHVRYL